MPINTYRGSITLPNEVSNMIIQSTQESSAIMALANRINLPGPGLTIPMITADPEADWVAETAAKPVSNPSLSTKVMTPYKLAVIVPFSDEFARDYDALYDALVARIPGALAKKFDATVFHGSAPGSGFNVLAGCTAQTISGSGNSFYGALVNADVAIAAQGGDVNGYAFSPQARGALIALSLSIMLQKALSLACSVILSTTVRALTRPALPDLARLPMLSALPATGQRHGTALWKASRSTSPIRQH